MTRIMDRSNAMTSVRGYGFIFSIAGLVILSDQLAKALVRANLPYGTGLAWTPLPWLYPYFKIVFWRNTGASLGILRDYGGLLAILSFVVAGLILYFFGRAPRTDRSLRLALSLLLGGILGNLIDRLAFGYVTDFISIDSLPVFNLADVSNYMGVLILLLGMWREDRRKVRQAA